MRTSSVALSHIQIGYTSNWTVGNRTSSISKGGKRQKKLPLKCLCLHKARRTKLFTLVLFHLCRDFVMERVCLSNLVFKEKKELTLFARAMGFSTTDPIWEVLENSLDYRPPPQNNDGFPNLFCRVPIRLNGER